MPADGGLKRFARLPGIRWTTPREGQSTNMEDVKSPPSFSGGQPIQPFRFFHPNTKHKPKLNKTMANISREERLRREAESAKNEHRESDGDQSPASETPVQESPATKIVEESVQAVKDAVMPEKSIYSVDDLDVKHFKEHKLKEEKQKSLDAIEQAIRDACKITEDKIRRDSVVVALSEDPGDVEKRLAFLRKYGPSNVKPPRPEPTHYGVKDIALMEWMAKYEPEEFIRIHGNGRSEVALRLLKSIRQSA